MRTFSWESGGYSFGSAFRRAERSLGTDLEGEMRSTCEDMGEPLGVGARESMGGGS